MQETGNDKIISIKATDNETIITLVTGSFLGETSIHELPHGIINKSETGIGATTLELKATRNSIIVEPHKITASSKAHKHNGLYIGSPTKYHPKRKTDAEIKAYLIDSSITHKKIVIVADSLDRLFKILESINPNEYEKYFLMLDEVDSFQHDSTFRDSMEAALDIYKKFDHTKRALVTATLIPFSDPELEHEDLTVFNYDTPTIRDIDFINTNKLDGSVIDKIKQILIDHPDDKIMVAYNSVKGSFDLAEHLVKHGILPKSDINILCSVNSEKAAKDYYSELKSDYLPAKLCFVTSAYFSGYDIHEKYHLISTSSTSNSIYTLSDNKLKQIAGRARKGLLSETVIYENEVNPSKNTYTKGELIESAKTLIDSLECIEKHFKTKPLLKSNLLRAWESIAKTVNIDTFALVRHNDNNKPKISYLNIDAYLESIRVHSELYNSDDSLYKAHKSRGHKATYVKDNSRTKVTRHTVSKAEKISLVDEVIKQLKDLKNPRDHDEVTDLLNNIKLTKNQTDIISTYIEYKDYINTNDLISKLEKVGKKNIRAMESFKKSAEFVTLADNNPHKRTIIHHLPIGRVYTGEELLKRWNEVFTELGSPNEGLTKSLAAHLTNQHFETKRDPKKKTYKIIELFKLKVESSRADILTTRIMEANTPS